MRSLQWPEHRQCSKSSKLKSNISGRGFGSALFRGHNMNDTYTTEQVMARLQVLHDQLNHTVQKWNGKTTITQSDLDVIKQAITELKK